MRKRLTKLHPDTLPDIHRTAHLLRQAGLGTWAELAVNSHRSGLSLLEVTLPSQYGVAAYEHQVIMAACWDKPRPARDSNLFPTKPYNLSIGRHSGSVFATMQRLALATQHDVLSGEIRYLYRQLGEVLLGAHDKQAKNLLYRP